FPVGSTYLQCNVARGLLVMPDQRIATHTSENLRQIVIQAHGYDCCLSSPTDGHRIHHSSGKRSPNIGRPLTDAARVTSSSMTSQCSASRPSWRRTMSKTIQFAG